SRQQASKKIEIINAWKHRQKIWRWERHIFYYCSFILDAYEGTVIRHELKEHWQTASPDDRYQSPRLLLVANRIPAHAHSRRRNAWLHHRRHLFREPVA